VEFTGGGEIDGSVGSTGSAKRASGSFGDSFGDSSGG